MADGIIDIRQYLDGGDDDEARSAFSLWGADGERSRFALPLWRVIYLSGGDRGAIASAGAGAGVGTGAGAVVGAGDVPRPLIVLDLRTEPARLDFSSFPLTDVGVAQSPMLTDLGSRGLAVLLGESVRRRWYLLVDGRGPGTKALTSDTKENILFLAGECAGLLFFRDLAGLEELPGFEEE